jgi:hypothetical protein
MERAEGAGLVPALFRATTRVRPYGVPPRGGAALPWARSRAKMFESRQVRAVLLEYLVDHLLNLGERQEGRGEIFLLR